MTPTRRALLLLPTYRSSARRSTPVRACLVRGLVNVAAPVAAGTPGESGPAWSYSSGPGGDGTGRTWSVRVRMQEG
jgi:hypothetical protein